MINIVTALACEANPIIQRYALRKRPASGAHPIYENDAVKLIISGMGKFASASAVGYLQSLLDSALKETPYATVPHIWLNVGIAGHGGMDLGTPLLAHKIGDPLVGRYYYPCFTFEAPCRTVEVITVDKAETHYPANAAYDMEALGFCAATSRFSSFELIHCLKIVSDNDSLSQQRLSKHLGEDLVANQMPVIDALIDEFHKIQRITNEMYALPADYFILTEAYRFTVTQQNQLKKLLLRWHALTGASLDKEFDIRQCKNAKQLLAAIEARLQLVPVTC